MTLRVAIVDHGMGNLYSVERACAHVGLLGRITSEPSEVEAADAVILPGVGAFQDAMESLRASSLADTLHAVADANKPIFGICLGLQLLMTVSFEFGRHQGLGLIPGSVVRFQGPQSHSGRFKVPLVGWRTIRRAWHSKDGGAADAWRETPLENLQDGEFMYFVHSYYVVPEDPRVVCSLSCYEGIEFCSSLWWRNIFGCQFHPERSGPMGLNIYRNFKVWVSKFLPTRDAKTTGRQIHV